MSKVETKDNNGWWMKCFRNDKEKIEVDRLSRSMYDCSPEVQKTAREMFYKIYSGNSSHNK